MGIRIEDSICVQDEHPLVLTTEAVKEVGFLILQSPTALHTVCAQITDGSLG